MDTYSPEFSAYWLDKPVETGERHGAQPAPAQALSPSQEAALAELAERVNAARSVL